MTKTCITGIFSTDENMHVMYGYKRTFKSMANLNSLQVYSETRAFKALKYAATVDHSGHCADSLGCKYDYHD